VCICEKKKAPSLPANATRRELWQPSPTNSQTSRLNKQYVLGWRSEEDEKKKATSLPANRNGVSRGINGKASGNGKSR
jgi:phosphopantothenoylcysteine synthetase/decarboxylase